MVDTVIFDNRFAREQVEAIEGRKRPLPDDVVALLSATEPDTYKQEGCSPYAERQQPVEKLVISQDGMKQKGKNNVQIYVEGDVPRRVPRPVAPAAVRWWTAGSSLLILSVGVLVMFLMSDRWASVRDVGVAAGIILLLGSALCYIRARITQDAATIKKTVTDPPNR